MKRRAALVLATAPEVVTRLIGNPISRSHSDEHLTCHLWGPPPSMPRTGDTWLTYSPQGSQHSEQSGFTGLVMKFDTSEPVEQGPDPALPET